MIEKVREFVSGLKKRKRIKKAKPVFRRQESHKHARIKERWRRLRCWRPSFFS